jgi:hypothetical protein
MRDLFTIAFFLLLDAPAALKDVYAFRQSCPLSAVQTHFCG